MAIDRFRVLLRHIRRLTTEQADVALTDRELLQRYIDRHDETAFAALVRRHGGMVLVVCRRVLHQQQDAEDAFQAVFVILARKASAPGWQESIGNWPYQVAYRLAMRASRQAARRQARAWARSPDRAPAQSGDPVAEVTLREAQQASARARKKSPFAAGTRPPARSWARLAFRRRSAHPDYGRSPSPPTAKASPSKKPRRPSGSKGT